MKTPECGKVRGEPSLEYHGREGCETPHGNSETRTGFSPLATFAVGWKSSLSGKSGQTGRKTIFGVTIAFVATVFG
jgi:hypothetical protein